MPELYGPKIILILALPLGILLFILIRKLITVKIYTSSKQEEAPDEKTLVFHQAIQKAQTILGETQFQGNKIVESSGLQTQKIEEKLNQEIDRDIKKLDEFNQKQQQFLEAQVSKASKSYEEYLDDLRKLINQAQQDNQQVVRAKVNEIFEGFEQNLTDFLTRTQERSVQAVDLELRASRQLIDTYKLEQIKLIDENIIAMLEKTLSIVLNKKLTLKDHADLVYEALEKAKVEKFII